MPRLRRTSPDQPGWTRRRAGKGWVFLDESGERLADEDAQRCKDLVIPPAWTDVWITPYDNGHLQAVGTDDAGRRQYLYHPAWRSRRDAEKFDRVLVFGRALSKARDVRYCLDRAVAVASAGSASEAIDLLSLVIEVDPNSVHAFNQRGWRYQQQGLADLAFQDFLASARLGNAWGQLMTGKYYWAGKGVKEDRDKAEAWLRKAAAQGNRDAKLSLEQALAQRGRK